MDSFRVVALILILGGLLNSAMWAQDAERPAVKVSATATPDAPSAREDQTGNRTVIADQPAQNAKHIEHDSRNELLPGEDPENHLVLPFVKHLASDQRAFWKAPAHFQKKDIEWFAPFAGLTAGFIAGDSWISKQIPLGEVQRSKKVSDYGVYSLIGAGAGSFLLGHITGNDHMSEAGLLSGEAAINSTAVAYLLKNAAQRPRPFQANGNGTFFQGGNSFPSEHAAIAWSVASVLAHEYPGTLSQILAYGLATGVSATRVTGQQHFASDVIIGSALGWYFGRQVYRAHHDTDLGGAAWGDLLPETAGDKARNPENMGSPYVPVDSWVYPILDRLAAMGYVRSAYAGIRPWTRMECARLVEEASDNLQSDAESPGELQQMYDALATEFADESRRLDGASNVGASLDSVYTRFTGISGPPLRDGYHFGQTIVNDYGRPYSQGFNNVTGVTAHAVAGPFSISLQGEYQRAPAVASDPASVLHAIAFVDRVPAVLPDGSAAIDRFRLVEGSIGLTLRNVLVSFGRQNLWWGPGESGSLMYSNNAAPVTMLQIDNITPFEVPLLSRLLGPARMSFFVGELSGQHWIFDGTNFLGPNLRTQPFIHGNKLSFKPTPNLEFGMGVTAIFAGPGLPFTLHEFLRSYYGHNVSTATNPGKRFSGFDFTYRVPGLRQWLTVYNDAMVGDEISPIGSTRPMLNPGLYFPQLPKLPRLELRVEGFKQQPVLGLIYFDRRYHSGYTNDGNLLGSWIGRDGNGGQAIAKYSFSARTNVKFEYRHQEVDRSITGGGRLNDFGAKYEIRVLPEVTISGGLQYEKWRFPVLQNQTQSDTSAWLQVAFHPNLRIAK